MSSDARTESLQAHPLRRLIVRLIPLGIVLLVAAVIRWHNIGDLSLWLDELAGVRVARAPLESFFSGVRSHAAAAPLDYVAMREVLAVLGTSTLTARLWAFTMGVLTVALVYGFTRELTNDRRTPLLAAVLTATAPFLVFYSQEARPYSMAAALAVAVPWAYARLVRTGRPVDWVTFAAVALLSVYTHYFLALLLLIGGLAALAVAAWRAFRSGRWPAALVPVARLGAGLTLVGLVTALAFAPWFQFAARDQLSIVYLYPPIPPLTPESWARTFMTLLSAAPRVPSAQGDSPLEIFLTVSLGLLALLGLIRLARTRPQTALTLLVFIVGLIPLVWYLDARAGYFVSERQFIFLVPHLLVLAGVGAIGLADWITTRAKAGAAGVHPRRPTLRDAGAAVIAAVLVASTLPGMDRVYAGTFRPKEDWRRASAFVAASVCPDGRVYANVGPDYYYGVTLYAPQLEPRAVYLAERGFNEFLVDILRRHPITTRDTVVVFRDRSGVFVPGRGDIQTVTDYLYGIGLRAREFTPRIRVFMAPACPGS